MARHRIPKEVIVGGEPWKVLWEKLEEDTYGECHILKRTITLNPDQPPEGVEKIFFHELIHAALATGGAGQILSTKQEEMVAHCLMNPALAVVSAEVNEARLGEILAGFFIF